MIEGLVSTVVPVFNRAPQLREAVASVLSQDRRPVEIVIVDDGSTDDTPSCIAELVSSHAGTIFAARQKNGGPGAARRFGTELARGEFIQYLDSDDVLLPGKFTAQVAALRENPKADAAYGIALFRDAHGRLHPQPLKRTGERIASMFPTFLNSRWWDTSTPLYRRMVLDAAGPWSDLRLEEDWEYDCRVACAGGRLAWVDQPVSEQRDHPGKRLSRGAALDPARLRDRARAHASIHSHAERAGITSDVREMQQFARSLFLLSRQCGAAGLVDESRELFQLARKASGEQRSRGLDFQAYRAIAAIAGWHAAGAASRWADSLRTRA